MVIRIFAALLSLTFISATSAYSKEFTPEMEASGKVIYEKRCIGCHGPKGKGDGPASERLRPKPRNLARGLYKFTYTKFGKLPQDETLFRWVTEGLPGTTMPAWKEYLSDEDRWNVVAYIKSLSKKFKRAKKKGRVPKPIEINVPASFSEDDLKVGKAGFLKNCQKCHGEEGRGSGPSAVALKDDWGDRIWPRNLRKGWTLRGGNSLEDIYRTVATGISGTPMPAHLENMKPEEIWPIVGYVDSFMVKQAPNIKEVVVSKFSEGELPSDPMDEQWSAMELRYYPMVSNIVQGDRHFKTTLDAVYSRSLYNDKEIAIYVEWADRSKSPLEKIGEKFPVNKPDAFSIQLPTEIPTAMEKPYFLGGDSDRSVVIWKWINGEKPTVSLGKGFFKQTVMGEDNHVVTATVKYDKGLWKAVFKRPLVGPTEDDLTIEVGRYIPMAFNAWDGNNGEENEKRAITIWYWLLLEPPSSMTVYLFPLFIGLLVAAGEVVVIRNKNNKS